MKQRSYSPLILTLIIILVGLSIFVYKMPFVKEAHTTSEINISTINNVFTSKSTLTKESISLTTITKTTIFDEIGDSSQPSVLDIEYVVIEKVGDIHNDPLIKITLKFVDTPSNEFVGWISLMGLYYETIEAPSYVIYLTNPYEITECTLHYFQDIIKDDRIHEIHNKKSIDDFNIYKDTWIFNIPLSDLVWFPGYKYHEDTEFQFQAIFYPMTFYSGDFDEIDKVPNIPSMYLIRQYVNVNYEKQLVQTFYSTLKSTITSVSLTSSTSYSTYYVNTPIKERNILFPLLLGSAIVLLVVMILNTSKNAKADIKEEEKPISIEIEKKHCIFCG